jgi:NADH-quinone oxidoreductase subunit J
VLLLFVLMLVHQEDLPEFHGGRPVQRAAGFLLGLVLLGEIAAAVLTRTVVGQPGPWSPNAVASVGGNVQAIGRVLYSGYVLPIQATALVLLAATIGALVLARPEAAETAPRGARGIYAISLGHPRGQAGEEEEPEIPALPADTVIKPEAGERDLVMARTGDEFVEQPAWGERNQG